MLEEIREKNNLTRPEMQKRLNISKSYYSMIINGERPISKNLGLKINKEFGEPLEKIFASDVHVPSTTASQSLGN